MLELRRGFVYLWSLLLYDAVFKLLISDIGLFVVDSLRDNLRESLVPWKPSAPPSRRKIVENFREGERTRDMDKQVTRNET